MSNSSKPIRVVLWRHGQTDWNVETIDVAGRAVDEMK